jgi:hypothetical protein
MLSPVSIKATMLGYRFLAFLARRATTLLLASTTLVSAPQSAFAHGGLAMEEDYCRLRVGKYFMHFTGYQPDSPNATKEFCEDIPATGNTIIVLDYVSRDLRDLPTEVRIVKDTGREQDLEAITVFHLPAKRYPTGSLSLEYNFAKPGRYVGLVTVGDQEKSVARFPFSVGSSGNVSYWLVAALAAAAAVALYFFGLRQRGLRPTR